MSDMLDDFDLDLDSINFDDLDFEATNTDKGGPVFKVGKATLRGVSDNIISGSRISNQLDRLLPVGLRAAKRDTGRVYEEFSKEFDSISNSFKRSSKNILLDVSKMIPKGVLSQYLKKRSDSISYEKSSYSFDTSEDDERKRQESVMAEVFADVQTKVYGEAQARNAVQSETQHQQNVRIAKTAIEIADETRRGVMTISRFNEYINVPYQKKSLELRLKALYISKKHYELSKLSSEKTIGYLEGILHNSAVPDFRKTGVADTGFQTFRQNRIDQAFGTLNLKETAVGRAAGRLSKRVSNAAKGMLGATQGVETATGMSGAMGSGAGYGIAGDAIGNYAVDFAYDRAGRAAAGLFGRGRIFNKQYLKTKQRFSSTIDGIHERGKEGRDYLSTTSHSPVFGDIDSNVIGDNGSAMHYQDYDGKYEVVRDKNGGIDEIKTQALFEDTMRKAGKFQAENKKKGLFRKMIDRAKGTAKAKSNVFISEILKEDEYSEPVLVKSESDLYKTTSFDVRTHTTINKVIPGLLSRINSSVREGSGLPADIMKWDYIKGEFATGGEMLSRTRSRVKSDLGLDDLDRGVTQAVGDIAKGANLSDKELQALQSTLTVGVAENQFGVRSIRDYETLVSENYRDKFSDLSDSEYASLMSKLRGKKESISMQDSEDISGSIRDISRRYQDPEASLSFMANRERYDELEELGLLKRDASGTMRLDKSGYLDFLKKDASGRGMNIDKTPHEFGPSQEVAVAVASMESSYDSTLEKQDESIDVLNKIYEALKPKEHRFGDADGDGLIDSTWQAKERKKKKAAEMAAMFNNGKNKTNVTDITKEHGEDGMFAKMAKLYSMFRLGNLGLGTILPMLGMGGGAGGLLATAAAGYGIGGLKDKMKGGADNLKDKVTGEPKKKKGLKSKIGGGLKSIGKMAAVGYLLSSIGDLLTVSDEDKEDDSFKTQAMDAGKTAVNVVSTAWLAKEVLSVADKFLLRGKGGKALKVIKKAVFNKNTMKNVKKYGKGAVRIAQKYGGAARVAMSSFKATPKNPYALGATAISLLGYGAYRLHKADLEPHKSGYITLLRFAQYGAMPITSKDQYDMQEAYTKLYILEADVIERGKIKLSNDGQAMIDYDPTGVMEVLGIGDQDRPRFLQWFEGRFLSVLTSHLSIYDQMGYLSKFYTLDTMSTIGMEDAIASNNKIRKRLFSKLMEIHVPFEVNVPPPNMGMGDKGLVSSPSVYANIYYYLDGGVEAPYATMPLSRERTKLLDNITGSSVNSELNMASKILGIEKTVDIDKMIITETSNFNKHKGALNSDGSKISKSAIAAAGIASMAKKSNTAKKPSMFAIGAKAAMMGFLSGIGINTAEGDQEKSYNKPSGNKPFMPPSETMYKSDVPIDWNTRDKLIAAGYLNHKGEDPYWFNKQDDTHEKREKIKILTVQVAKSVGLDPKTFLSFIAVESGFRPYARPWSRKLGKYLSTAMGVAQILEGTWKTWVKDWGKDYGITLDLHRTNVKAALMLAARNAKDNMVGNDGVISFYLPHLLGAAGAKAYWRNLKKDPHASTIKYLSFSVISGNKGFFFGVSMTESYNKIKAHLRALADKHDINSALIDEYADSMADIDAESAKLVKRVVGDSKAIDLTTPLAMQNGNTTSKKRLPTVGVKDNSVNGSKESKSDVYKNVSFHTAEKSSSTETSASNALLKAIRENTKAYMNAAASNNGKSPIEINFSGVPDMKAEIVDKDFKAEPRNVKVNDNEIPNMSSGFDVSRKGG